MAIRTYLAMTASEFAKADPLPPHVAWMACHFSPYGTGLSNLPFCLPPDSLLILNDRIPIQGHDPERIGIQLKNTAAALGCSGILLDFQRPNCQETQILADHLVRTLPCPVCVSDLYAKDLDCPVFLPPCSHHVHLENHIEPWKDRDIWLDLARNAEMVTVTSCGSSTIPLPLGELPEGSHEAPTLHAHYFKECVGDSIHFTLWRTQEDLQALCQQAETLGIRNTVMLLSDTC